MEKVKIYYTIIGGEYCENCIFCDYDNNYGKNKSFCKAFNAILQQDINGFALRCEDCKKNTI